MTQLALNPASSVPGARLTYMTLAGLKLKSAQLWAAVILQSLRYSRKLCLHAISERQHCLFSYTSRILRLVADMATSEVTVEELSYCVAKNCKSYDVPHSKLFCDYHWELTPWELKRTLCESYGSAKWSKAKTAVIQTLFLLESQEQDEQLAEREE
jgi:hypothetical protein